MTPRRDAPKARSDRRPATAPTLIPDSRPEHLAADGIGLALLDRKYTHRKPCRQIWARQNLASDRRRDRAALAGSCIRWRIQPAMRAAVARYWFLFRTLRRWARRPSELRL